MAGLESSKIVSCRSGQSTRLAAGGVRSSGSERQHCYSASTSQAAPHYIEGVFGIFCLVKAAQADDPLKMQK